MNPTRPTYASISLDNIAYNVQAVRGLLKSSTELMAVVKADGYGHGAVEVAGATLNSGASRLAVAILDEAIELRRAGIGAPILVLGHTPPDLSEHVVKFGLTATVTDADFARDLSSAATRLGRKVKVHLKVDTGMRRLGVQPREAVSFADFLRELHNLELEGVYTHFASADAEDIAFARTQLHRFNQVVAELADKGHSLIRHAANTAAILSMPDSHLDLVRLGIGLYGLYPATHLRQKVNLRPAMALQSHIAFLKWIEGGEPVSYGGTHVASGRMRVATVPIGYADGYSRQLSNQGYALVNGAQVPVVGRVCMDQLMLDVTNVECRVLDEVVLIGAVQGAEISADTIAGLMGTINYEVTCLIGRRVPRVFIRGGQKVRTRSLLGRW